MINVSIDCYPVEKVSISNVLKYTQTL